MFKRVLALALLLAACSSSQPDDRLAVSVFAASSLTDAFAEVEASFEAQYPEFDVQLNLASSSALREQVRAGAPVDVLAVASQSITSQLEAENLVFVEGIFATNSLTVALAPGNPGGITSLADLERDELLLGVCAVGVPCGDLAAETLEAAGLNASVDTQEPDVRSLLTKIEEGELDAGIVYQSDVESSDVELETIDFELSEPPITAYPVAIPAEALNIEGASAFVNFVLSEEGRNILAESGFGFPE